jgi:acetyltransferase
MHLMRSKPAGRFSPSCLFRPDWVAVVGSEPEGEQVLANLRGADFKGSIEQVETEQIAGLAAAPDLAVVAVPAERVADALAALAAKGCFAAILTGAAGDFLAVARQSGIRVLGPRSFGVAVPSIGLNASRAHMVVPVGRLGLVSQSAALCRAVLDWAGPNGIGFSHIVGIGDNVDLGFAVALDWLSRDPGTGAILLDIRHIKNRRAFLSAARAAARLRPVVAIRPGTLQDDSGGGAEQAFEAALRRAGVLTVSRLEDMLAAAETLSRVRPVRSDALAIVSNSIGPARLAADEALREGLHLASPIVRVEPDDRLADLAVQASASDVGGVLVVHAPTSKDDNDALATLGGRITAPLLICVMGETTGAAHRRRLAQAGLAVFATPEQAVRGFLHLVKHARNRAAARELPSSAVLTVVPDREQVRAVLDDLRRAGRVEAMQDEALAVLSAYGIPIVPTRAVVSAEDAIAAARLLGFPAVLKLRDTPGMRAPAGLALDLHDADEVAVAARLLAARRTRAGSADHGLIVQRQAMRARELRVRIADDATFGTTIGFGQGGTTAAIAQDIAIDLPPLNLALAQALIARTRVAATLAQFRDMPAANIAAVAETLVRISQLVIDFPEIAALELNPLLVDADGVLAADAWLSLRAPGETSLLAIAPYPVELVEHWTTRGGERLIVRPIRPEDAEEHGAFFHRLSPQDIRFRFFTAMREMSAEQMARLTQVDYDREMAFIAARESNGETIGVARLVAENEREGEFAIIVQQDAKGKGIATHLMRRLIDWARRRRLATITGQVLSDNAPMLAFVRGLGFHVRRVPGDAEVVEAKLNIDE